MVGLPLNLSTARKIALFMAKVYNQHFVARNKAFFLAVRQYGGQKSGEQSTAAGEYAGPAARSALRSSAQGLLHLLRAGLCPFLAAVFLYLFIWVSD